MINKVLIIINLISFTFMGIDKVNAIRNKRRISEKTLLTISLFGGALGTILAMLTFRHKIRKPKFIILVPIFLILTIFILNLLPCFY